KPSRADHINIPETGTWTTGQNRPVQPAEQTTGKKPSVKKPKNKFRPLFAVIIIMIAAAAAAAAVIVRFEDIRNELNAYIPAARSIFPVETADTPVQGPGENMNIPVSPEAGGTVLSDEHAENILLPAENSSGVHIADNREASPVQPERITTGKEQAPDADLRVTITFNMNSETVDPAFYPGIGRLIKAFSERPGSIFRVEGHTDNVGPEIYNINLSMRRAIAVKGILTNKGIAGEKIKIALFGDSEPQAPNDTISGRMRNRRVEIVLVPAGTE
ncbi:MAG: OmpA family protein, partial [Nitrospirota bacterium]|nr:OmpA family protein [Nitrospirota bacterium]